MLTRAASLGVLLLVIWLLLSGHYTLLMISFGVLSCLLVLLIAARMKLLDQEGQPLHLAGGLLSYLPWLAREVVRANLSVMRVILSRRLAVEPRLIHFEGTQETELGRVVYANSITLTPGTITTGVAGRHFQVHALTREARDGIEEGEMDRRVTRLEGAP